MTPLAAMPTPVAETAMPASIGPAQAGGETATGFADALHRASGGHGPEQARPEGGPQATKRNGQGPERETRACPKRDDDQAAAGVEPDDTVREHAPAAEAGDAESAVGRKRIANDEGQVDGGPTAMPGMTTPTTGVRGGARPGAQPGRDALSMTAGPVGGHAARAGTTMAGAPSTEPQDPGIADPLRGQADGELASTGSIARDTGAATTAAGLTAQAATLPAGAAAGIDATKPAGASLRRSTGVLPTVERSNHGPFAGVEGRGARAVVGDARSAGIGRAAPGNAIPKDPVPVPAQADGAAMQGFEDALLASLAQGNDPGAAIATGSSAPTPSATAGGLRPIALPIATPIHSAAFPQALGQQLAMALRMDLGQAELILSPAELGPVRVELSLDGDAASVHFAATSPETRQALEQSLPSLRALLAEQGLSLADTHVGAGFHRENDDRRAEPAQGGASDRRTEVAIDGQIRPMNARIRPDALVDLFA